MNVFAVAGYKKSGKSTLCRALLAALSRRSLSVGYVKRTQEEVVSPAGTDSGEAVRLGFDVLLWGEDGLRFERGRTGTGDPDPEAVAGAFFPEADVVILEGGKELVLPKIWVLREGEEPPDNPGIFALYDRFGAGDGGDRYGGDEVERLADRLASLCRGVGFGARIYVDDRELPIKDFIADFVEGGVRGMLGSLKGVPDKSNTGRLRVYLGRR